MQPTPALVAKVMDDLARAGIDCLLFGGWAEEALGLCQPRVHADIDLLLPAESFGLGDRLLASGAVTEIAAKRFAHKRAFLVDATMVELTLVQQEDDAAVTWFWGDVRFEWLQPLAEACMLAGQTLHAVSQANLKQFRTLYKTTEPWRWREPASL